MRQKKRKLQGWAPRSLSFLLKNATFFSVLFLSFWRLMEPKRTFRSFLKNRKGLKERNFFCKECKNVPFFYKEQKITQQTFPSFIKNRKECKERRILL